MSMLLGVPAHRRQLGNKDVGAFMLPLVTLEGEETLKLGAYCLTLWCPSHLKGSRRKALSNVCCHDVSVAKIQIIFWLSKLSRLVCSVLTLESELSSQRFCLPFFPRSAIKEHNWPGGNVPFIPILLIASTDSWAVSPQTYCSEDNLPLAVGYYGLLGVLVVLNKWRFDFHRVFFEFCSWYPGHLHLPAVVYSRVKSSAYSW